ncbi:MAG: RIP metalloprotease RseP [Candidatus Zixiibacteriota bacterium]
MDIIVTIFATIIALGALIIIHELGHFLMAKLVGVKVEKFSMGFPPILWRKKIGETEYSIGIPYGGFVKMKGDEADYEPGEEGPEPDSFYGKSVGPRALIISGGVIFNIILAFLLFFAVNMFWGIGEAITDHAVVGMINPGMPAEDLGVEVGDTIIAIDGLEVETWMDMVELVHALPDSMVSVTWRHDGETITDSIITYARVQPGYDKPIGLIGIGPASRNISLSFGEAVKYAALQEVNVFAEMVFFIYRSVTGNTSMKELGGVVMIAQMAGKTAKMGISKYLIFIAFLSINLAFINLLPFPVFDGGHLVFLGLEAIRGKRLPLRIRSAIQNVGIVMILMLIVLVTSNDIMRFFR